MNRRLSLMDWFIFVRFWIKILFLLFVLESYTCFLFYSFPPLSELIHHVDRVFNNFRFEVRFDLNNFNFFLLIESFNIMLDFASDRFNTLIILKVGFPNTIKFLLLFPFLLIDTLLLNFLFLHLIFNLCDFRFQLLLNKKSISKLNFFQSIRIYKQLLVYFLHFLILHLGHGWRWDFYLF